jgi:hypothetical protein
MRRIFYSCIKLLCLFACALILLNCSANAQTYGSLHASTLSCTRSSLALGNATLPTCSEAKFEDLDSVYYYISAYCEHCGVMTLISIIPIHLGIGLANGPCTIGVAWNFAGGYYPASGASPEYIGGSLSARSSTAFGRISSSVDCNNLPVLTGNNGQRLDCK